MWSSKSFLGKDKLGYQWVACVMGHFVDCTILGWGHAPGAQQVVNVDGLDISEAYKRVIKFCQIIIINGHLDLIPDTLYNFFVCLKNMFLGFTLDK